MAWDQIVEAHVYPIKIPVTRKRKRDGKVVNGYMFKPGGVHVTLGNGCRYGFNFRHETYNVKQPDRPSCYKSGTPDGRVIIGETESIGKRSDFEREFAHCPRLLQLIDQGIEMAILEDAAKKAA
jgi:hypothetical protein